MSANHGTALTLRVLRRSRNHAAVEVLAHAVHSGDVDLRIGAVRALAERPETESQAELLGALMDAPSDARRAACGRDATKRMRKAVIVALKGGDVPLIKQACRYAIDAELFAALPTLVEQAMDADHPYAVGLATATLRLCQAMASRLEAPSTDPAGAGDPAFYRTTTLQRLAEAAERFGEHRRLELVESLLLVTTRDNSQLMRLLRTDGHVCHDALTETLAVSPSFGALDVLCHALIDSEAPTRLLKLAEERADRPFLARLAEQVGYPIGVRPRENAKRMSGFAWMTPQHRGVLTDLGGKQQATAVSLAAAATAAPLSERFAFVKFVLRDGTDYGRAAACHLLKDFNSPEVPTLLGEAIKDTAPGVVAAAARQLRSRGINGAEVILIGLLEHPAEEVRHAAQGELHELNLASYRALFEQLSEPARRAAGRLVVRADPDAQAQLAVELSKPIPRQRLEGLAMIDAMGLVDTLAEPLAAALADKDVGVRSEAARLLGASTEPSGPVFEALVSASGDGNLAVRAAAQKSLDTLRSLDTASGLIDQLQDEFLSGDNQGAQT